MRVSYVALAWPLLWLLPGPAVGATGEAAQRLVADTTTQMLTVLHREREALRRHPYRIYDLVDAIVLPHFDFSRMSRWVLGKHWRRATPGQRARFVNEFKTLLVRTYATALLEYSDQSVVIFPVRVKGETSKVKVRAEIRQPRGGLPIPIDYSMYANQGRWKVYDVTIDGVSLVANYRASFSSYIQRHGLDGLLQQLAARNAGAGR